MRHTVIELGYAGAGLLIALLFTWGAAWAYPPGRNVIWIVGGVVMVAVVALNWPTVSDAMARDREQRS